MNRYVIVSGLPASGKSTIATALSRSLSLPLLDKDHFLEALFVSRGIGDAQWRKDLSREADESLRQQAEQSAGAVIASWWKHPQSDADSGTPTEWLFSLPGRRLEVLCRCGADLAARRFLSRERHAGHLDGRWSYPELLADFEKQASLGPLRVGPLVEVSTEGEPDLSALMTKIEIETALERAHPTDKRPANRT